MLFLAYPGCTTCKKAKKFLEEHEIDFEFRHIKDENPTLAELTAWYKTYNFELKKLFNTSGQVYRQMQLKDVLPDMTDEEKLTLLASDGMLVKRPLLLLDDRILIGFKEAEWRTALHIDE